jgi:DNA-directed RNA polymerase specialized sigma24 family protein
MRLSTIAASLGTTVSAVKLRLHRATTTLRGALAAA